MVQQRSVPSWDLKREAGGHCEEVDRALVDVALLEAEHLGRLADTPDSAHGHVAVAVAVAVHAHVDVNVNESIRKVAQTTHSDPRWPLFCWDVPSVLLELGYLSSKSDEKLLTSAAWQTKIARAFATAMDNYFDTEVASKTN